MMIQSKKSEVRGKKLLILLLILTSYFLLLTSNSFAELGRSTSFDDRGICEKSRGVWRQFGNGCVDECRSKLDPFIICTDSANFGCDCGKGKCWNGETCVMLKDYKKIFDEEQLKEKEVLSEIKKKREKEAIKNQQGIIANLIARASSTVSSDDPTKVNNNLSEILKRKNIDPNAANQQPIAAPVPVAAPIPVPTQPAQQATTQNSQTLPQVDAYGGKIVPPPNQQQNKKIEELPPIIMPGGETIPANSDNVDSNIPPFFLQQEKAKEKAKQNQSGTTSAGLPEIPLPN
jgi:hypothetical protein